MTLPLPGFAVLCFALFTGGAPAAAQTRDDYLTREEVALVRRTREPSDKIKLFLDFAAQRLSKLEKGLRAAGEDPDKKRRELTELFEDYIRAVDDVSGHVEMWLNRGGADLRKLRKRIEKDGPKFSRRLGLIRETNQPLAGSDLRYELEDAMEATLDMIALGAQIPGGIIPPKLAGAGGASTPAEPQPGKPTLRRKGEDKEGRKVEDEDKPPGR